MSAMPIGDLPGWRQILAEDFTAPAAKGSFLSVYGSRWSAYPEPWKDTSKVGTYSPERTLSVADGMLAIHLHTEQGVPYVAAPLPRLNGLGTPAGQGVTYGRFSMRFRADPVPGYKTAWLLWPDSDVWPGDGEIDFPEGDLTGTISAFHHYARSAGGQAAFDTRATYQSWHVATIEWTPGRVVFILDGSVIGTSSRDVPNKPMHLVLQTETNTSGRPVPPEASGTVLVDWVAAYALQ